MAALGGARCTWVVLCAAAQAAFACRACGSRGLPSLSGHVGRRAAFLAGASPPLRLQARTARPATRAAAAPPVQALALGWVAAGAALGGLFVGLLVAKWAQNHFRNEFDEKKSTIENALLRAKVRPGGGRAWSGGGAGVCGCVCGWCACVCVWVCKTGRRSWRAPPVAARLAVAWRTTGAPREPGAWLLQVEELQQMVGKYEPLAYKNECQPVQQQQLGWSCDRDDPAAAGRHAAAAQRSRSRERQAGLFDAGF